MRIGQLPGQILARPRRRDAITVTMNHQRRLADGGQLRTQIGVTQPVQGMHQHRPVRRRSRGQCRLQFSLNCAGLRVALCFEQQKTAQGFARIRGYDPGKSAERRAIHPV